MTRKLIRDYYNLITMIPSESLSNLILAVGGFLLGYLTKTVLPYEYFSFRESQKKKQKEMEEWKDEVQIRLTELSQLSREFDLNKRPDIDEWIERMDSLAKEIEQIAVKAPDNVDEDLVEELTELSGVCVAHKTVIADLYHDIYGEEEGKSELPMPYEYDNIHDNKDELYAGPVLREMLMGMYERTQEQISELKDMLEEPSSSDNHTIIQQLKP